MSEQAARYARIAAAVRKRYAAAARAARARALESEAAVAATASVQSRAVMRALASGRRPNEVAHDVDQALRDATERIGAAVTRAIPAAREIRIGTPIEDFGGAAGDFRSWDRAAAGLRAQSAAQVPAAARFHMRTEPARAAVVARVREGLQRGEGIRQLTRTIRATDTTQVPIPRYVADVIDALNAGRMPEATALREAASRLGSSVESFATIKPAVERLARVVEKGNEEKIRASVQDFVERRLRYEATRIARTETMRAHATAAREQMASTPGVEAVEWVLSGSHPVEDICDMYANADLYGLGPGRYPVDKAPELPAHPGCTCAIIPVISAESIGRALRGEPPPERGQPAHESPEAWLRSQPEHVQDRILGRGAAGMLRNGETVTRPDGSLAPLWELRGTAPPTRAPAMLIPVIAGRVGAVFRQG